MAETFTPDYFVRRSKELTDAPQEPTAAPPKTTIQITPNYFVQRSQELQAQAQQAPSRPDLSAISPSGPGTAYPTPAPAPPPPSAAGGLRGLYERAFKDVSDQTGGPRGILPRMAEGLKTGFGDVPEPDWQHPWAMAARTVAEAPGRALGGAIGMGSGLVAGLAETPSANYPGIPRNEADRLMREGPGVATAIMQKEVGAPTALRAPEPVPPGPRPPPTLHELAARVGVPRAGAVAPEEIAASVGGAMRESLGAEKTRLEQTAAVRPEGRFKVGVLEGLGTKISGEMARSAPNMVVDNLTPATSKALDYLNAGPSKFNIKNRIGPQLSETQRADVVDVNLSGLKQIRDNLTKYQLSAKHPNDVAAMDHLINTFDQHLTQAMTDGLFSGDKDFLSKWRNADKAPAQIKALFEGKSAQDGIIAKLADPETKPKEIANYLLGSGKIGLEDVPVKLWDQFSKNMPPEKLQQWRETMFDQAVKNGQVRTLARSDIGKKMYDPPVRALMDRYVDMPKEGQVRVDTALRFAGFLGEHLIRMKLFGTGLGRHVGPMVRQGIESLGKRPEPPPPSYGGPIGVP